MIKGTHEGTFGYITQALEDDPSLNFLLVYGDGWCLYQTSTPKIENRHLRHLNVRSYFLHNRTHDPKQRCPRCGNDIISLLQFFNLTEYCLLCKCIWRL